VTNVLFLASVEKRFAARRTLGRLLQRSRLLLRRMRSR